jgi:hypothetical protein
MCILFLHFYLFWLKFTFKISTSSELVEFGECPRFENGASNSIVKKHV